MIDFSWNYWFSVSWNSHRSSVEKTIDINWEPQCYQASSESNKHKRSFHLGANFFHIPKDCFIWNISNGSDTMGKGMKLPWCSKWLPRRARWSRGEFKAEIASSRPNRPWDTETWQFLRSEFVQKLNLVRCLGRNFVQVVYFLTSTSWQKRREKSKYSIVAILGAC